MQLKCCFCGQGIEKSPAYCLLIQKVQQEESDEVPTQELYCHEKCLEDALHDANMLYLKHL